MLFNSAEFLTLFLPLVFFAYFLFGKYSDTYALGAIIFASVLFYANWSIRDLYLIAVSILVNFSIAMAISKSSFKKAFFGLGLLFNLCLLFYFKYIGMFYSITGWSALSFGNVALPLAISFYTFQQITYLGHIYRASLTRQESFKLNFFDYCLFILFFPHLVAGPIVRDSDFLYQMDGSRAKPNLSNFRRGIFLFLLGLTKKSIFADGINSFMADRAFGLIGQQQPVMGLYLLMAMFAYALQIYFDFSGYSDMALGAASLLNFKLPINFNSPYRAHSIEEFWRRWHITLSLFLRDYLYIPLGGNRKGAIRRNLNLMITMLLGGLWHGANYTFVLWGGLHGLALVIHKFWPWRVPKVLGVFITFVFVSLAWVPFRANNFNDVFFFYKCLFTNWSSGTDILFPYFRYNLFLGLGLFVAFCPWNSQYICEIIESKDLLRSLFHRIFKFCTSIKIIFSAICGGGVVLIVCYLYYANNLDFLLFKKGVLVSKTPVNYVESSVGTYRQNFLNTTFVHFSAEKYTKILKNVAIVGSSYATEIKETAFTIQGNKFLLSSIANNGQDFRNFVRQIKMAENFAPAAIMIAISPMSLIQYEAKDRFNGFRPNECLDLFDSRYEEFALAKYENCGRERPNIFSKEYLGDYKNYGSRFSQFRNFVKDTTFGIWGDSIALPVDSFTLDRIDNKKTVSDELNRLGEILNKEGSDLSKRDEDWSRIDVNQLRPGNKIYSTLQKIKTELQAKNINLLIYATPIAVLDKNNKYPLGQIEAYRKNAALMAKELQIPFLDLSDFLPANSASMSDFLHTTPAVRKNELPKRIALFYMQACANREVTCIKQ